MGTSMWLSCQSCATGARWWWWWWWWWYCGAFLVRWCWSGLIWVWGGVDCGRSGLKMALIPTRHVSLSMATAPIEPTPISESRNHLVVQTWKRLAGPGGSMAGPDGQARKTMVSACFC